MQEAAEKLEDLIQLNQFLTKNSELRKVAEEDGLKSSVVNITPMVPVINNPLAT